jgi:hypothetical protein
MVRVPRRGLLAVGLSALLIAAVAAAPVGAATEVAVPAEVRAVPWVMRSSPDPGLVRQGPRTFNLAVGAGGCGPKIRFDHVKVIERPRTANRPFRSAVISAFVLIPEHTRSVRDPAPPTPSYAGASEVVVEECLRGGSLTRRIKLKRPVAGLRLYDGFYSPPRRVRPPVRP